MEILKDIPFRKLEILIAALTLVCVSSITFLSRQLRIADQDAIAAAESVEIILHKKTTLEDLADLLEAKDVIKSKSDFVWVSRLLGWRNFRRGRYEIDGGYSYDVFLSKLARGIQDPVNVTILPGIDLSIFSEKLSSKLHFNSEDVIRVMNDSLYLTSLNLSTEKLFGRMLPETYLMYWTIDPKNAINRILEEFDSQITQQYVDDLPSGRYDIDDIITMASIIEWEAKNDEEKSRISGLYWNRIKTRMRLQADPTVNFALGERRRLLFEDYEFEHPYNTYKIYGLPPSAITNPSISSIEAAVFPEDHDYLYMVASPEGAHVFSSSFEEHQVASERWRKWLREQFRIKRQKEREENVSS